MKKTLLVLTVLLCTSVLFACQPIGTSTCVKTHDLNDVYGIDGELTTKVILKSKHEKIIERYFIEEIVFDNEEEVNAFYETYTGIIDNFYSKDYFEISLSKDGNTISLEVVESKNQTMDRLTYYDTEDKYRLVGYTCTFK